MRSPLGARAEEAIMRVDGLNLQPMRDPGPGPGVGEAEPQPIFRV